MALTLKQLRVFHFENARYMLAAVTPGCNCRQCYDLSYHASFHTEAVLALDPMLPDTTAEQDAREIVPDYINPTPTAPLSKNLH